MKSFLFGLLNNFDVITSGIIGGIIGGIFGHRLSLRRDRRKEFNEIAEPIRELLLKERRDRSPYVRGLTKIKVDQLESVLPWWSKRRFRTIWNAYQKSKEQLAVDPVGGRSYRSFDEIAVHIDRLLRYTKRQ